MKLFFQTSQYHKSTRTLIFFAAVILMGLLSTAVTGCSGNNQEPVAVALIQEGKPVEAAQALEEYVTATALQAVEEPRNTTIPPSPTTLTPLPTASSTSIPASTPAETAVETATGIPTEFDDLDPNTADSKPPLPEVLPTATKPPPLPTPSGVYSWTLKVPILMYHYISEPPAGADKYRKDLSVTPEDFEKQMTYLAENGFESVDLYDLSLAITNKRELPQKPVVITLDDGYEDNYSNAFPILQKYGMAATFFVVTEFIDEGRKGYLNWDMVKEMAGAGMRIEPHSKTHPDLRGAEPDYVIYEALGSQETIAAHIGYTPRYFCYPGGFYDEETIEIIDELGFWGAVTTADGTWHGFDDRFEWSRIRMRNTTTLADFASMVNPYDTVAGKPAN